MSFFRRNGKGTGGYWGSHKEAKPVSPGNTTDEVLAEIVAENGLYEEVDSQDRLVIRQGGDFNENSASEVVAQLVGKAASYQIQYGNIFANRKVDLNTLSPNEGMSFSSVNLASLYEVDGVTVKSPTKFGTVGILADPTEGVWGPTFGSEVTNLDAFRIHTQAVTTLGPYQLSIDGATGVSSVMQVFNMEPIIRSTDNLIGVGDWQYQQTLEHTNGNGGEFVWEFTETNLQSQLFNYGDFSTYRMSVNRFGISDHDGVQNFSIQPNGQIGILPEGVNTVGAQVDRIAIFHPATGALIGYIPVHAGA